MCLGLPPGLDRSLPLRDVSCVLFFSNQSKGKNGKGAQSSETQPSESKRIAVFVNLDTSGAGEWCGRLKAVEAQTVAFTPPGGGLFMKDGASFIGDVLSANGAAVVEEVCLIVP